ncbi:uncharacterized protein SOCEGT47_002520 [Sorangium cellulosum]|uniref:Uncharacterized protein n=1 Tax=Sorangium cellulosum TaxID=56 RepID=A0A4P2PT59_SORCE|nr:uncharacterized protein SOCEGT47_002520 [Sorangium cellulosum]
MGQWIEQGTDAAPADVVIVRRGSVAARKHRCRSRQGSSAARVTPLPVRGGQLGCSDNTVSGPRWAAQLLGGAPLPVRGGQLGCLGNTVAGPRWAARLPGRHRCRSAVGSSAAWATPLPVRGGQLGCLGDTVAGPRWAAQLQQLAHQILPQRAAAGRDHLLQVDPHLLDSPANGVRDRLLGLDRADEGEVPDPPPGQLGWACDRGRRAGASPFPAPGGAFHKRTRRAPRNSGYERTLSLHRRPFPRPYLDFCSCSRGGDPPRRTSAPGSRRARPRRPGPGDPARGLREPGSVRSHLPRLHQDAAARGRLRRPPMEHHFTHPADARAWHTARQRVASLGSLVRARVRRSGLDRGRRGAPAPSR